MASTDEILFVVMIVILFFIALLALVYLIHRMTGPRQQEQVQFVTASQLEAMRPSTLKQVHTGSNRQPSWGLKDGQARTAGQLPPLSDWKIDGFQQKVRPLSVMAETIVRPSSVRQPSFKPMQSMIRNPLGVPTIVLNEDPNLAKSAYALPPPAYGDYRASRPVRCDETPFKFTGKN
ncbi:hypothetical protein PHYBLDRAFT_181607 [Phycomyces blakesleeanus NRRL 1555(-)]|uniref:Uncharacterized protein n=2 Tax=Phycomyces blakesleeanus TaxID=4837 RepID=A0A162PH36_PHYB8|nr:hypothetical protein PHYBLDRAFT_181607 [Phycomyces blakesleeanus NRRL 1555(-)]OAD72767.1 hypothetical protein PHYBLDRAFT_181607 [Phycomyces blakesleeanus NRRL 1555(-)]|eukprot:XP_018290807.1 hypothetical protein PHYBLDRAFT_181607 [Phycomyces blakesleeanus NRRL 1555(-)]